MYANGYILEIVAGIENLYYGGIRTLGGAPRLENFSIRTDTYEISTYAHGRSEYISAIRTHSYRKYITPNAESKRIFFIRTFLA